MDKMDKRINFLFNRREILIWELRKFGKTYREIGSFFKISASRVSQIYCHIVLKIKEIEHPNGYSTKGFPKINVRVRNVLEGRAIKSLREAQAMKDIELLRIPGLGKKALQGIRNAKPIL